MAHTRRGFSQARSQRRKTVWAEGPGGSAATAISATGTTLLAAGVQFLESGLTLVRLRGSVAAYLSTADAATAGLHCAFGIGIVTEDAFNVGVTATPKPIADAGWGGWLYHRFFDLYAATANVIDSFQSSLQWEIDSKAMRKLDLLDVVFMSIEAVEVTNAVMQVNADSRILFKLP